MPVFSFLCILRRLSCCGGLKALASSSATLSAWFQEHPALRASLAVTVVLNISITVDERGYKKEDVVVWSDWLNTG